MVVENWTALLVLVLVSIALLVFVAYIVSALRQWDRAPVQDLRQEARVIIPPAVRLESSAQALPGLAEQDAQSLWNSLTRREKQVARLAAKKMTDAEIARELGISERTVGNHLYNIFGKLDINSRHEIKFILHNLDDDSSGRPNNSSPSGFRPK